VTEIRRIQWPTSIPAGYGIAWEDLDPIRPPDTDEEPWYPTDPPGFSMTGGDVFVLAAVVVAAWAAVVVGVLLLRKVWSR
jgi:hypothetical protein